MEIKPYTINISKEEIDNLKYRLKLTSFPDELPDAEWEYGIPLDFIKEIMRYWQDEFKWNEVESRINSFSNYKVNIDGIDIHFIHERGSGPNAIPIIIPHGWPGSFYEMLDIIPYLTTPEKFGRDPAISFDVVIPSIPGHGFSGIPLKKGFEDRQAADIFVKLMKLLGYERFGAHGYDLGASIVGLLCLDHPENIIGYHTTSPGNPSPYISNDTVLTKDEKTYLDYCKQWYNEEGGYAHILGTKPQTLAYSLNDSPLGLAAFILEKWYLWTSPPNGDIVRHFSLQTLMANVSIYWFTQTINSSNRFYFEGKHTQWPDENDVSNVPLGVSLTATQPHERPPKEYVERLFPNIISWEELNMGGHFVATENPKLVAEHIQKFFGKVR
ncbi:epoxide hydrolase [Bacillus sp. FJAT-27225]|uniref:epoxide hydrolase family protein n=1 Tax=Bacillus sp. FJAT-27225 TaxID=1743144 RepID=UPI00080C305A|nr:epoxide hydrolase family protein [Bacillus sp. FJAT-27225]OCA84020.1 epoxide hydrolase [Bacillus sp. FJAT-27225]